MVESHCLDQTWFILWSCCTTNKIRVLYKEKVIKGCGVGHQKCLRICFYPFRSAVPNLFGPRDRFHGRQLFHRRGLEGGSDRSGGNASGDGEQWGAADEGSLPHPLPTSCCAAWFLRGQGPLSVHGLGVGDPWSRLPHLRTIYKIARNMTKIPTWFAWYNITKHYQILRTLFNAYVPLWSTLGIQ